MCQKPLLLQALYLTATAHYIEKSVSGCRPINVNA